MHIVLLLYSLGSIVSKCAANEKVFSVEFVVLYGIKMLNLFLYAILWQQVLKRFSLTTAFANKTVTIIWGLILGLLFFGETVSLLQIVGSIIIMIGICVAVSEDE